MKDGWMYWEGKKVFISLKNRRNYSGVIIAIDDNAKPLVFLTINDKFGNRVTFSTSEIAEIKEEH